MFSSRLFFLIEEFMLQAPPIRKLSLAKPQKLLRNRTKNLTNSLRRWQGLQTHGGSIPNPKELKVSTLIPKDDAKAPVFMSLWVKAALDQNNIKHVVLSRGWSVYICMHLRSHRKPYLLIFVPGERLRSQDKPVFLGSPLHDTDVYGEPASANHLHTRVQQWLKVKIDTILKTN